MFCKNCGTQIHDSSIICTSCGNSLDSNINNGQFSQKVDNPSHAAGIASGCFPTVGLTLYFLWKDEKPKSASLICKWMIAGIVGWVLLYVLFFIIAILGSL